MRIFKNKTFAKWAKKEGLDNELLRKAVREMERGLVDVEFGRSYRKKASSYR